MFRGGFEQLRLDWWVHLLDTRTVPYGAGGLLALLPLALFGTVSDASPGSIPRPRIARQVILVGIAGCAAVTYLAPMFLGRVAVLQPYRFLIPLAFFACIPAGAAVARVLDLSRERRWLAWAGVALVLAVVGNAVHGLSPLLAIGHGNDAAEDELVAFLERATTEEDRILVESTSTPLPVEGRWWGMMGVRRFALLPLRVRREFLGYIGTSPFTAHRYASFEDGWLFGRKLSELSTEAVSATLRRYAISFAVGCSGDALSGLGKFPNLLEETASAADCRIFRVREPERSRFLEGDGRVRADLDRIEVKEARGERLVLKYHWVPNLKTEPPLPIEEVRESGIPVGFIAVRPEGTEQFTIRPRTPLELASVFGASH
jgi:hypothetical protein